MYLCSADSSRFEVQNNFAVKEASRAGAESLTGNVTSFLDVSLYGCFESSADLAMFSSFNLASIAANGCISIDYAV
jgi:hypothetical protein